MSKAEIRVVTNSLESYDWVEVYYGTDMNYSGHSISPRDLVDIINSFYSDDGAELVEVNDEQMNEGVFK